MLAIFTWVNADAAGNRAQQSEGRGIPLAFALMQRKETEDYQAVFEYIFGHATPLSPTIHCDYGQALWSTVRNCVKYQKWEITGCWFHFSQALYRRLASLASEEQIFTSLTKY